jgi:putative ABC transport system ATP-binding protein
LTSRLLSEKWDGARAQPALDGGLDLAPAPFVRLENLSKSYQEGAHTRIVLRDASTTFGRGEFAAILGKSGSGKSTLLNLISGIDRADGGAVWLNGRNLTALDERQRTLFRRRNIGFVFQFLNLIPTLTVWENVVLPLELGGVSSAAARRSVEPVLDAVGLLDRRGTFPDRLSGGEQQRVAIARALVHDPLLVLADEPTGNLDEQTGRQVLALLDRLTRQAGKNLILVTHNAEAAAHADRIMTLRGGGLVDGRE